MSGSPELISPFLWFDTQALEAAEFYVSVFPRSRVVQVVHYGPAGPGPQGSVMTVEFELAGRRFIALNGGPLFPFTEAISLSVSCADQAEVDYYWDRLTSGGEESQCGWLKDRFGVSWQVNPEPLLVMLRDADEARATRAMRAMLTMRKIDLAAIETAFRGE